MVSNPYNGQVRLIHCVILLIQKSFKHITPMTHNSAQQIYHLELAEHIYDYGQGQIYSKGLMTTDKDKSRAKDW